MKQEPLFYIPSPENDQDVDGPYELAQMAQLLRANIITAETPTCQDGEEEWKPFGERPQFATASQMPPAEVLTPALVLEEPEAAAGMSMMVMIGVACVLLAAGGALTWLVSAADPTMGVWFAAAGGVSTLAGCGFTLAQVTDETWGTRLKVLFVPFLDVFYFRSNLEKCLPFISAKYIGAVLALAAIAGIFSVGPFWESILSATGLR